MINSMIIWPHRAHNENENFTCQQTRGNVSLLIIAKIQMCDDGRVQHYYGQPRLRPENVRGLQYWCARGKKITSSLKSNESNMRTLDPQVWVLCPDNIPSWGDHVYNSVSLECLEHSFIHNFTNSNSLSSHVNIWVTEGKGMFDITSR